MAGNYLDLFTDYFHPYNDFYYTKYNIIDGGIADEGIYYDMALDQYSTQFDSILNYLFLYFYNIKPVLLKHGLIRKVNNNEYIELITLNQLRYFVKRFILTQHTNEFPQILIENDLQYNYKIYFHQDLSEIFLLFFLFLIAKLKIINNETDYLEETYRLLVSNISSMPEGYYLSNIAEQYISQYLNGYMGYNPFIEAHVKFCQTYYHPDLFSKDDSYIIYDEQYQVDYVIKLWDDFTNNLTIDEIKTKVINLIHDEFNIRLNETDIKKIKKSTIAENLIKNYYRYYEKYYLIYIDGHGGDIYLSNFNYNNGYMSFPWSLTQTYFNNVHIPPVFYYTTDYNVNINPGPWEKDYLKQHYKDTINVDTAYGFPTGGYYLYIEHIEDDYYLIGTNKDDWIAYEYPPVSYEEHKSKVNPNCKIKNLTRNKFTLYYYEDDVFNTDFTYLIDVSIFTPLFYKNAKCSGHISMVSSNFYNFISHFKKDNNLNDNFYTEEIKKEIYKFTDRIAGKKVFITEYTYTDTMEDIIPKNYIKQDNKASTVDMGHIVRYPGASRASKKGYITYGEDQKYSVNRGYYGYPYTVNKGMRINIEFNEKVETNLLLHFRRADLDMHKLSSYETKFRKEYTEENNEVSYTYNSKKYLLGKGNIYQITNFNESTDIAYFTPSGGTYKHLAVCPYRIDFFSTRFPKDDYTYYVYKDEEIHEYLKVMYLYVLLATTFNSWGEDISGTNITNYDIDLQNNASEFSKHLLSFWVNNFKNKTIDEIKEYLFEYIRQNTIILNTNINLDFNTLNNTIFNKVINNYVIYEGELNNWINYTEIDSIKNYQVEPYYSFF